MGLVRQRAGAGAARRLGRQRGDRDDDALAQPGSAGAHHRGDQEAAHRLSGPRAAHGDGTHLRERRRARRRAQGDAQQDRAARVCDQFQRARHVRGIPRTVSRWPGEVPLPRHGPDGDGVPSGNLHSGPALPRNHGRGARGARPLQHRAAGPVRRQPRHPRFHRRHLALRSSGPATRTPRRATAR